MGSLNFILQRQEQILELFADHLLVSLTAIVLAIVIGVGLGIVIARKQQWAGPVVAAANVIQTMPALALFALLMPVGDRQQGRRSGHYSICHFARS